MTMMMMSCGSDYSVCSQRTSGRCVRRSTAQTTPKPRSSISKASLQCRTRPTTFSSGAAYCFTGNVDAHATLPNVREMFVIFTGVRSSFKLGEQHGAESSAAPLFQKSTIFRFWVSGTLVLRVERQSARKSKTKNSRLASLPSNPLVTVSILDLWAKWVNCDYTVSQKTSHL